VIVPVRDGLEDIRELVDCLGRQTLPSGDIELVIGDDGSSDGIAESVATEDGRVRVASGPAANSYAARNRAVAASRAPVLAFCDSDCRPEPEWLERGLAALAGTDLAAGRIRFRLPPALTAWSLVDMDGSKDHESQVRVGVAETANLFLRRELFDRVGGFDGSIPEYGDYEFVQRCVTSGADLSYAPEAVVWHPVRTSARSLLKALWKYNRGYAVHAGRAREMPDAVKLRSWVPLVQAIRGRRRGGRSLGPDRRWLHANDVEVTLGQTLRALPILYLVIPYLRCTAQLAGWLEGRRRRSEAAIAPQPESM
jgi:glycosyltransferase involved in cell wall biosynthesis